LKREKIGGKTEEKTLRNNYSTKTKSVSKICISQLSSDFLLATKFRAFNSEESCHGKKGQKKIGASLRLTFLTTSRTKQTNSDLNSKQIKHLSLPASDET